MFREKKVASGLFGIAAKPLKHIGIQETQIQNCSKTMISAIITVFLLLSMARMHMKTDDN